MLKIIRDWKLQDFLRSHQGLRSYGIPVSKNYMALQWFGAYAPSDRGIIYFLARQIDSGNEVIANYDIGTTYIKYESGQYLYDDTMLFDGILPDGVFFFEFRDSYETYRSEIFRVKDMCMPFLASGTWKASGSFKISQTCVTNASTIILKKFEDNDLYEFEN